MFNQYMNFFNRKDKLNKQENVYSKSLDRNLAFLTLKKFFQIFFIPSQTEVALTTFKSRSDKCDSENC